MIWGYHYFRKHPYGKTIHIMIEKLRTTYLAKTQVPCQKYTTTKLKGALRDYGTISQSFAEDIRYIVNSD